MCTVLAFFSALGSQWKWVCLPAALAFVFVCSAAADTTFPPTDAGTINIGHTPGSVTATFTLSGLSATPNFSLLYQSDFALGEANCNGGFTSCSVPITFTPKYPGLRRDLIVVRDSAHNLIGRIPLTGTGKGAQAAVAFGNSLTLYQDPSAFNPLVVSAFDSAGNGYGVQVNQILKVNASDHSVSVIAGQSSSTGGYDPGDTAGMMGRLSTPSLVLPVV